MIGLPAKIRGSQVMRSSRSFSWARMSISLAGVASLRGEQQRRVAIVGAPHGDEPAAEIDVAAAQPDLGGIVQQSGGQRPRIGV
jgi:hypothetical protein